MYHILNIKQTNGRHTWESEIENQTIKFQTDHKGEGAYYQSSGQAEQWVMLKSPFQPVPHSLADLEPTERVKRMTAIVARYARYITK